MENKIQKIEKEKNQLLLEVESNVEFFKRKYLYLD